METAVPIDKNGLIMAGDDAFYYHNTPLYPPGIIAAPFLGELTRVSVPYISPVYNTGEYELLFESKCVLRVYCRQDNSAESSGDGSVARPFNKFQNAVNFCLCMVSKICVDYFQIFLYHDGDAVDISTSYYIGIPLIVGDLNAQTKSNAVIGSGADSIGHILANLSINAAGGSRLYNTVYQCDIQCPGTIGTRDLIKCDINADAIIAQDPSYSEVLECDVYANHLEIGYVTDSTINSPQCRYISGTTLSNCELNAMYGRSDTYSIGGCSFEVIADSQLSLENIHLYADVISDTDITSVINITDPVSISCDNVRTYILKPYSTSSTGITISNTNITGTYTYSETTTAETTGSRIFGLFGVLLSEQVTHAISNLTCNLTTNVHLGINDHTIGYKFTCSVARNGSGCLAECAYSPYATGENMPSFSCQTATCS